SFLAHPCGRHSLYIVEPQVRVELFRLRFAPQRLDFLWPCVVGSESKQVAVLVVERDILEVVIHQLCHVFGAAMDVGIGLVNVADAESAGSGVNAVQPAETLEVRVGPGHKGPHVTEVLSVHSSTAVPMASRRSSVQATISNGPSVEETGTVKWFN